MKTSIYITLILFIVFGCSKTHKENIVSGNKEFTSFRDSTWAKKEFEFDKQNH